MSWVKLIDSSVVEGGHEKREMDGSPYL